MMDMTKIYTDNQEFVELFAQLNELKKKYNNMTIENFNKMKEDLRQKIRKLEKEINNIENSILSLHSHKIIID